MTTGLHTVRDICCSRCKSTLGWKYVRPLASNAGVPSQSTPQDRAYETPQKYKEGKYILEKALLREVESIKDDMGA